MDEGCSSNKYHRIEEIDNSTTSSEQILPRNKPCSECQVIDEGNAVVCEECLYYFCSLCVIDHNEEMRNKLQGSNCCQIHNESLTRFCTENKCELLLCISCVNEHHRNHSVVSPSECLDYLSNSKHDYKEKMEEIIKNISKLEMEKTSLNGNMEEIKSLLRERHANVLSIVNSVFDEQYNKLDSNHQYLMDELDAKIRCLKKMEKDLKNADQLRFHFPGNPSGEQLLIFFQSASNLIKFDQFNFGTRVINPTIVKLEYFQYIVEELLCKIDTILNRDIEITDESAIVTTVIHETTEMVQDVCYDATLKNLFILKSYNSNYKVLKFSNNVLVNQCSVLPDAGPHLDVRIALMPHGRILVLFCKEELQLVSEEMKYEECIPIALYQFRYASAICTSPCLTHTYGYVYNSEGHSDILRYSHDTHSTIKKPLSLDEPVYMTVHEDPEYIAFVGRTQNIIYLYSFDKGEVTLKFQKEYSLYNSGCFLSEMVFMSYDFSQKAFEIFSFWKNKTLRYIRNVLIADEKTDISFLQSITKCNSNYIFASVRIGPSYTIYKMKL